jgi:hypothetical protein
MDQPLGVKPGDAPGVEKQSAFEEAGEPLLMAVRK